MKGGYQIVNLRNTNIETGGTSVYVAGVYNAIAGNRRKPVIVTGLKLDGEPRSDRWVNFRPATGGGFSCQIGFNDSYVHLILTVASNDMVQINEL